MVITSVQNDKAPPISLIFMNKILVKSLIFAISLAKDKDMDVLEILSLKISKLSD
jgi:hypothetical protein